MFTKSDISNYRICSIVLILFVLTIGGTSCYNKNNQKKQIEQDLKIKMEHIANDSLFEIINKAKNSKEREALSFLYAYMPIGDIADYPGELFLEGVRLSFRAAEELNWRETIPEELFMHFVLPLRVNNESLDNSREIFYNQLKERVKGLSLYDAAIEVNRWCQEKVVYTPTDGRTSSPLATVKSAYGRCGEESVFTVAAMRSVGIPARLIYTPRWAHTDDNHAWVEVWTGNGWHYLGACEPEPRLDIAWFSSTATRGLLMHARVFGRYQGAEEVIGGNAHFTEINVTPNYAPVTKVRVRVIDSKGESVEGAKVDYKIYNYAEFYTAISNLSDAQGASSATLGRGEFLVWASKGERFGFVKASPQGDSLNVEVALDRVEGEEFDIELEITPPAERVVDVSVSEQEREENNRRVAVGDSIRGAYLATFASEESSHKLANRLREAGKEIDNNRVFELLKNSRGNHIEISQFLEWLPNEKFNLGLKMLSLISQKDLRDAPFKVLKSHIEHLEATQDEPYIINPRVANEVLTNWREELQNKFKESNFYKNPNAIEQFMSRVKISSTYNPQGIPITPMGVLRVMSADRRAVEGLFIALCRSFEVPARFNEITGVLEYRHNGEWLRPTFSAQESSSTTQNGDVEGQKESNLKVKFTKGAIKEPKYEIHYAIAKMESGSLSTLALEDALDRALYLPKGYYTLTSGTRLANGKVLAKVKFFNLLAGERRELALEMREDKDELMVIGSLNPETLYYNYKLEAEQSILSSTGRGFYLIVLMRGNHEPSVHVLKDLIAVEGRLKKWGRKILFLYDNERHLESVAKEYSQLWESDSFILGADLMAKISKEAWLSLGNHNDPPMPLLLLADSFGRVVWYSAGYTIGVGEQLLQAIKE